MIHFTCPHCRTGLGARDDKGGKKTRCPKCRTPIEVPVTQAQSAPTPAGGASTPIPDSKELEPRGEQHPGKRTTGLLMLSLFVSGLVCGTILFVVLFFKIKEERLSTPVHSRPGHARPAVGKTSHNEPPPPHRFLPDASEEDTETAESSRRVPVLPAGLLTRKGREPKVEEFEAQPLKSLSSVAPPPAMPSPAPVSDDPALRESEALVAPFMKDFRHQKVSGRLQAIEAVARLGPRGRAASRGLCDALFDPSLRVRLAAAEALDRVNSTLHSLVIPIMVDKELDTRLESLRGLGRLGPAGSAAVPVVVYFKQQHAGCALAVDVLAAIAADDPSVTAKMAGWLGSDPDPYVRLAAAKALPHMAGAKNHVRALLQSLRVDPADAVRAAAANGLGDLGPGGKDADRVLRMAKTDASSQVREAVERALKRMQKPASGEALDPR